MASSLLPKNVDSFADSAYWKEFFQQRGQHAFEWYGSYSEIGHLLEKYLKPTDQILQIGCGNSTLADSLYDNGFRRVISVDIVADVIKRQLERNVQIRPELEFRIVDVTKIEDVADQNRLQSVAYQVVLDKGTLDALLPPDFNREQESAVQRMFTEIDRVLAIRGRYLIVSLAQPDIVHLWVQWFQNRSYILRVHQMTNSDSEKGHPKWKLPTFLFVATKLKPPGDGENAFPQMYEFLESTKGAVPRRLKSVEDLLESVKSAQEYSIFCDKAKSGNNDDDLKIDLHSLNSSIGARYTIYLTTCIERRKFVHPYAIFVVPQGREHEWLFSTQKGRRDLASQAAVKRLAVVCLGRGHEFENIEAIKKELDERVMDFAPMDAAKKIGERQVPYLSVGEDLGRRKIIFRGESKFSGDFVVEEAASGSGKDEVINRRLIFLKSQNLIQSEAKLKKRTVSTNVDRLTPIDWSYLSCAHHRIMLASLALSEQKMKPISICLLGLGGGCLATYILKNYSEVNVTTIELDYSIVLTAQEYFEFPKSGEIERSNNLNSMVADGLEFIREKSDNYGQRFDIILLDVAGPAHIDGLSCPLPSFITDDCLRRMKRMLGDKNEDYDGVLAFNLVTRDATKRLEIEQRIDQHFPQVYRQQVEGELNEVLICFTQKHDDEWIKNYEKRLQSMCDGLESIKIARQRVKTNLDVQGLLNRLANM